MLFDKIDPGTVYGLRQYIKVGPSAAAMPDAASPWVSEAVQGWARPAELSSRAAPVVLVRHRGAIMLRIADKCDGEACATAAVACTGTTVPTSNTAVPLFDIRCGGFTRISSDPYALSPDDATAHRSYRCAGEEATVRPTWKLLGYFEPGVCDSASTTAATTTTTSTTTTKATTLTASGTVTTMAVAGSSSSSGAEAGAVVGGLVAGLLVLGLAVAISFRFDGADSSRLLRPTEQNPAFTDDGTSA